MIPMRGFASRTFLGAMLAIGLIGSGAVQKYPDHPVKVVVGFTAGGGTDVAARVMARSSRKR